MLLAIDTATRNLSLAMHNGDQVLSELTWQTMDYHTVELTQTISGMLHRVGLAPREIRAIAVALGPGSFTGLRTGLAVAKGLSLANNTPLIGIPTLDIVATSIGPEELPLCAVLQAGRNRICVGQYRWRDREWRPEGNPINTTWDRYLADMDAPALFAGEIDAYGARLLRRRRSRAFVLSPASGLRRAGFLAELGWERFKRNRCDNPATLAPIYLSTPGTAGP
jgi:tRNA threonylcarbamoyladenosine biosynthesis protein TsaB